MQKSFTGFALADIKTLKRMAESGINTYMEKEEVKKKIQHNIRAFLEINFYELASLMSSIQQMMNLSSIARKQQWEIQFKQIFLDHLIEEGLIEKLQRFKNEMTSRGTEDSCQNAVLP